MSSFYGHSVPSPLTSFTEEQYMPLAQYHSNHCILVNRLGRRFCDESCTATKSPSKNCSRSPKHAGCCFATSGFGPSTW